MNTLKALFKKIFTKKEDIQVVKLKRIDIVFIGTNNRGAQVLVTAVYDDGIYKTNRTNVIEGDRITLNVNPNDNYGNLQA